MSRENVEVVLAGYEAWNAGDMETYGKLLHPNVIMRPPEGWPEQGPFVGREAVLREFKQVRDTWEADAAEPISEPIAVGDKVLMRFHWRLKGIRGAQGAQARPAGTVLGRQGAGGPLTTGDRAVRTGAESGPSRATCSRSPGVRDRDLNERPRVPARRKARHSQRCG
jgi:ketosteroid isomerase-like protein